MKVEFIKDKITHNKLCTSKIRDDMTLTTWIGQLEIDHPNIISIKIHDIGFMPSRNEADFSVRGGMWIQHERIRK